MARDFPPAHLRPHYVRSSAVISTGLLILAVVVAVLLIVGSFLVLTQKAVSVEIDGQVTTIYTRQSTVQSILEELGLRLAPEDSLTPVRSALLENGATISIRRARTVLVEADGEIVELRTLEISPEALLAEAGIALGPHDQLWVDGEMMHDPALPLPTAPTYLRVLRAAALTIDDGGDVYTFFTTAPTVGEALDSIGMTLYLADEISPPARTPVEDGMVVTVRRSLPLTVTVGGVEVQTRTLAVTVGEALAGAGLPLVGEDYSIPPPEASLPPDGLIRVVRVTEDVVVERAEIPYQTFFRPDDTLELDQRRVIQAGVPGIAERRTRIRYEDGVEVSRVEEPARVTQPATDEIIAYGTRIALRTLDTPGGPLEYWRVIPMLATSYSAAGNGHEPGSPAYGITGTGLPLQRGIVAVDPNVIPYFTRVYVRGYGEGLAADSGGAVNGRRIDLGYSDDDLELWYGWVDVYLLAPAPPPEGIPYVLP